MIVRCDVPFTSRPRDVHACRARHRRPPRGDADARADRARADRERGRVHRPTVASPSAGARSATRSRAAEPRARGPCLPGDADPRLDGPRVRRRVGRAGRRARPTEPSKLPRADQARQRDARPLDPARGLRRSRRAVLRWQGRPPGALRDLTAGSAAGFVDRVGSPTYVKHLAERQLPLTLTGRFGLYHLGGPEPASRYKVPIRATQLGDLPGEVQEREATSSTCGRAAKHCADERSRRGLGVA